MSYPTSPLLLRRGPWTFLSNLALAEGEPYWAGILAADGTAFEMLYAGGHDGVNKLCGLQTCSGEPTFQAPAGAQIYDVLNQYIWISNGWSGGGPADGIDSPSLGMISASNFLGWTAFCPCITSNPPASGSGSGNAGAGGNLVVTPCCPGGVAQTVYLDTSGACNAALNGRFALTWDSSREQWASAQINASGTNLYYILHCISGPAFQLAISATLNISTPPPSDYATYPAASTTCSPFDVAGDSSPSFWNLGTVCPSGPNTLTWSVTD